MPAHKGETKGEFSVYWWPDLTKKYQYEVEKAWVGPEEALDAANRLIRSLAAQMGQVQKIIITDGSDLTNFEWEKGVLIFPTKEDLRNSTDTTITKGGADGT